MRRKTPTSLRNRALARSAQLLAAEGFGVSVDRLIAHSGLSRMTVYKYFGGKEGLLLAVLARVQLALEDRLDAVAEEPRLAPGAKLLAAFGVLRQAAVAPDVHGALLVQARRAFPVEDHPVHQAARHAYRGVTGRLVQFGRAAQLRDPESLACQLMALVDGSSAPALLADGAATENRVGVFVERALIEASRTLVDAQRERGRVSVSHAPVPTATPG